MNCRHFQHRIYEYLDGTLSPRARAAAQKHLAECAVCRQMVRRQQQVAQALSEGFRRGTESLTLPPAVRRRVLTASAGKFVARGVGHVSVFSWSRLIWPLATAAVVVAGLLLTALFFQSPRRETMWLQSRLEHGTASIDVSFAVPTYTFRREGALVIDALSYRTNVVKTTLLAGHDHGPGLNEQERKSPL